MAEFLEVLSFPFMRRALIVGVIVSLCAALLGVVLVLKRYSLIGHGLGEVGFAALALAMALGLPPMPVAIPLVVAASFLIMYLSQRGALAGDAAIGIMAAAALSFGVIVTSLSNGFNMDVSDYMFGSILAMSRGDVRLSVVLAAAVLTLYVIFYHKIFAITFDENFARATGVKAGWYNMLIALLTAITIVLGMRLMGTLLISSLVIFPALTSMRILKSFRSVVICSAVLSVLCFLIGIFFSYIWSTPTGASIVCVNIAAFFVFWAASFLLGRQRNR